MATCSYDEFRGVLKEIGFTRTRSGKHETWQKVLPDGAVLRVPVRHQHGKDIPQMVVQLDAQTGRN
jgi:hypothetical protein